MKPAQFVVNVAIYRDEIVFVNPCFHARYSYADTCAVGPWVAVVFRRTNVPDLVMVAEIGYLQRPSLDLGSQHHGCQKKED